LVEDNLGSANVSGDVVRHVIDINSWDETRDADSLADFGESWEEGVDFLKPRVQIPVGAIVEVCKRDSVIRLQKLVET
jgi:hypothetical protein